MYLTKSDFKAAFECPTRLYYRKNHYPRLSQDNEFMQMLADGGFMIELVAKARFPGGHDLAGIRDERESAQRTAELLNGGDVTIFEAGFIHGKFHVRTDILQQQGKVLTLIEVKSSSVEDQDDDDDASSPFLTKKGTVTSRWRSYLMDLAFQAHVLRLACPGYVVKPVLCVVNKLCVVTESETLGKFQVRKDPANPQVRPAVTYLGNLADLANSRLLAFRPVEDELATLQAEMVAAADRLAALITDRGVTRDQLPIVDHYDRCRKCDYRTTGEKSGFNECWGALAGVKPHLLDLYRVTQIGSKDFADPVPEQIRKGQVSILQLREDQLGENSYAVRRRMQWQALTQGWPEYLPPALRDELLAHQAVPGWPLHFIDFEACDIALPHHAGLRPFERVAFQWSCHTVRSDGTVRHNEWLNDKREFPNFGFVASLRETIGEDGTVYVWSWYEQTTLRKVLEQIQAWMARDVDGAVRLSGLRDAAALQDLAGWIDRLLGPADKKGKRSSSPRIRDLHRAAVERYFHPGMGGRTSIKVVLPSVWGLDGALRAVPLFAVYSAAGAGDPYKALPELPFGDDEAEDDAVREGTGAIRVYQDLIFTANPLAADQQNRRKLLLQYCRLDTAAMVMIWAHWLGRYDLRPA